MSGDYILEVSFGDLVDNVVFEIEGITSESNSNSNDVISVKITKIFDNGYLNFRDGMIITNNQPKFSGTSSGTDFVQVLIDGDQVGKSIAVADDGSWKRGWKNPPLDNGIHKITIEDIRGNIILRKHINIDTTYDRYDLYMEKMLELQNLINQLEILLSELQTFEELLIISDAPS